MSNNKIPRIKKLDLVVTVSLLFLLTGLTTVSHAQDKNLERGIYSRSNLIAWCIVPFDSKNRNAEERAQMLDRLGITKLAYDWREKHIPLFDEELDALSKHRIELQSFWYSSGMEPENDKKFQAIIDVLKRHDVKTQIWCMIGGDKSLETMSQEEKVKAVAKPIAFIANKAAGIGCSIGLYNHGGWFGEPENQLAIIDYLQLPNIGMVYNFSHAEHQIHRFPEFYPKILPHLYAINITGMQGQNPATVVPVGQGDTEAKMMKLISNSTYRGPVGIINENFAADAEAGLQLNIDGLKKILKASGDKKALDTYEMVIRKN